MDEQGVALPYSRALDGVRGLAVLAVLLFHGGVSFASGGFLGVSLFFTLSGYLITQLLVAEAGRTGRIGLSRFWARRLRRLLPASLACIVAVALAARFTDVFPGGGVRGDLLAALADVANWRFALRDASYAELFADAPSPVLHFWSLAIEEQFYLAFPVVVALLVAGARRLRLPLLPAGLLVLAVASTTAAFASRSDDLAYYGTHARAVELLAGALLALALPIGRKVDRRAAAALGGAGAGALVLLVALVGVTTTEDRWVYGGGLAAFSLVSVALLASTAVPGPVRWLCSRRPLVALGLVSYGVYVYHWPLFLVIDADRTGVSGAPLLAVRLAATLAAAVLSYVLLEQPVRHRRVLRVPLRARPALVVALALVAGVVLAVPVDRRVGLELAALEGTPEVVTFSTGAAADPPEPPPIDVLVLGSEARVLPWFDTAWVDGRDIRVRSAVQPGCPLRPAPPPSPCEPLAQRAAAAAAAAPPDVVVAAIGQVDRDDVAAGAPGTLDGAGGRRRTVGEEALAQVVAAAAGAPVLFLDTVGGAGAVPFLLREIDLARRDVVTLTLTAPDPVRLGRAIADSIGGRPPPDLRVVVIGDSTSYEMAEALDEVGDGDLEVVWAGRQNCAVVALERLRWWPGTDWDRTECPSVDKVWPEVFRQVDPDVVLVVASIGALAEHRYPGDRGWHEPGDRRWREMHDVAMARLQELLAPTGALTLVATAPPITDGGFAGSRMARPERLAAWNAQIAGWDAAHASVTTLDWGGILTAAEAQQGRSLRPDGVHVEDGALAPIVERHVLPALRAQAGRP